MMTEIAPDLANSLCKPLNPSAQYDIVFSKYFEKIHCDLSLRPLCIDSDLPVIYQWLKTSFGSQFRKMKYSSQQLKEVYHEILELNHSQSFLGLLGHTPAWQVDICNAQYDDIYSYIATKGNDYCMRMIIDPAIEPSVKTVEYILGFCISYFFSFKGVENIFLELDVQHAAYDRILARSGFKPTPTIDPLPYHSLLFQCSKTGFQWGSKPDHHSQH
jgi:Acetyltransferase (GNAT) domain